MTATKYVLIGNVLSNVTAERPFAVVARETSGPFEMAIIVGSTTNVIPKVALNSGSSKHGNTRRQSVDCICEQAMTCCAPLSSV